MSCQLPTCPSSVTKQTRPCKRCSFRIFALHTLLLLLLPCSALLSCHHVTPQWEGRQSERHILLTTDVVTRSGGPILLQSTKILFSLQHESTKSIGISISHTDTDHTDMIPYIDYLRAIKLIPNFAVLHSPSLKTYNKNLTFFSTIMLSGVQTKRTMK